MRDPYEVGLELADHFEEIYERLISREDQSVRAAMCATIYFLGREIFYHVEEGSPIQDVMKRMDEAVGENLLDIAEIKNTQYHTLLGALAYELTMYVQDLRKGV